MLPAAMRVSLHRCLFAAMLLMTALPVQAVTLEGLYQASVDVADKSSDARAEAFRSALGQVLVRLTGSTEVLEHPEARALLDAPAPLVQQFRYQRRAPEGDEADDAEAPGYRLSVTFAGSRIDRQLRAADIVVWGARRPEVLVWLAVDDGRNRRLVAADSGGALYRALVDVAKQRALPLLLPLMDTQDRSRVEFLDISGGFFDTVRTASDRYRADILLIGHVRGEGGAWRADWSLLGAGERRAWSGSRADARAAIALGVEGAARRLATMMAGREGDTNRVRVRVRAVDSLAAYARVTQYLEELVRVQDYSVETVAPRELVLGVTVEGSLADFERAVALGDALAPVTDAADAAAGGDKTAGDTGATEGTGEAIAPDIPTSDVTRDPTPERVFRFTG
jgi:hypothetical protein